MSIRPVGFLCQNSKTLALKFNKAIDKVDTSYFKITALDETGEEISISDYSIDGSVLFLTTQQQKPGKYYSLVILDSPNSIKSKDNQYIISEKISRTVFFIGFERYNPIRDSLLQKMPRIFLSEKSLVRDVISEQSESIYSSRKAAGELLSDNYIRESVEGERRVRSSSPMDRLANENAFYVSRVSRNSANSSEFFRKISFNESEKDRLQNIDSVVSLQQEEASQTIYVRDIINNKVSLDFNIIKLISLKSSTASIEYNFKERKYSIMENKYDENFALGNLSLKENELVIEKSFLDLMTDYNDSITVEYLTKNREVSPGENVSFYQPINVYREPLSEKTSVIELKNKLVCDSSGDVLEKGGITFLDAFSGEASDYFSKEIIFGEALPSEYGEFSIDHSSGKIYVYGDSGKGITSPVLASYRFRRELKKDYDFYIYKNDLTINNNRININNFGYITFSYENVFEEGYHYKANIHNEVMPENVGSNLTSSFSIRVANSPVTNVFRIINKTTQEIYKVIDFSGNEIYFSGDQSPRISNNRESARFKNISLEKLYPSEVFISNFEKIFVKSFDQNKIFPANSISEKLFDLDTKYFISDGVSNYEITSVSFSGGTVDYFLFSGNMPNVTEDLYFGTKIVKFSLNNNFILGSKNENIGSFISSSLKFSSPKFLISKPHRTQNLSKEAVISSKDIEYKYLTNLGNYIIDHINGDIYLCTNEESLDFGYVSYFTSEIDTSFGNAISKNKISAVYDEYFFEEKTEDGFLVKDIDTNFDFFNEDEYSDISSENYPLTMNSDYTVSLFRNADSVYGIYEMDHLFGSGETSDGPLFSREKSDIESYNLISKCSFLEATLDFKSEIKKSFLQSGSFYYFDLNSQNFSSFFSLTSDNVIISEDLTFFKAQLSVIRYTSSSSTIIHISDSSIFQNLNTNYDKVLIDGVYYDILSSSIVNRTITIDGNVSSGSAFLIQKCLIENNQFKIHTSSGIDIQKQYTMKYVPTGVPSVGTAFGVNYGSGKVTIDYNYLQDNIQVYYEYGDNEIEWLDSSFSEGEEYYVSYEYGALRQALKVNFGLLTGIPFFENFGLTTDREIYRDALEASLSSFQEGPTLGAISRIVESLSKTSPDISESIFEGWILGRDNLSKSPMVTSGDMIWGPVRYNSGLYFDKNTLKTKTENKLSFDEGTISFWARNQWDKIENDADLEIKIKEFLPVEYYQPKDKNILNIESQSDNSGVEIEKRIFIEKENSGFSMPISTISPLDNSSIKFNIKKEIKGPVTINQSTLELRFCDGYREFKLKFLPKLVKNISYIDIKSDFVKSFGLTTYYKSFDLYGTEKSILIDEKVSSIELSTYEVFPEKCFVMNSDGYIFKILHQEGRRLVIRLVPENWGGEKFDTSVSNISLSSLSLIRFEYEPVLSGSDSSVFGSASHYSEDVAIDMDRKGNIIKINGHKYYYTDFPKSSNILFDFISKNNDKNIIERFHYINKPHFNKDFIFIGSSKINPKSDIFKIKRGMYSDGIPTKSSPGVYFFTQNNDDFDLDRRTNRYWACEVVPSTSISVPEYVLSGETSNVYIPYSFSANIDVRSESKFYLVEKKRINYNRKEKL